jgi:hypothetical protein
MRIFLRARYFSTESDSAHGAVTKSTERVRTLRRSARCDEQKCMCSGVNPERVNSSSDSAHCEPEHRRDARRTTLGVASGHACCDGVTDALLRLPAAPRAWPAAAQCPRPLFRPWQAFAAPLVLLGRGRPALGHRYSKRGDPFCPLPPSVDAVPPEMFLPGKANGVRSGPALS